MDKEISGNGAGKMEEFPTIGGEDSIEDLTAECMEPTAEDVGNFLSALRGRGRSDISRSSRSVAGLDRHTIPDARSIVSGSAHATRCGEFQNRESALQPKRSGFLAKQTETSANWTAIAGSSDTRQRPVRGVREDVLSPLEVKRARLENLEEEEMRLGVDWKKQESTHSAEEAAATVVGRSAFVPYHVEAPTPIAPPRTTRSMVQLARDMVREIRINDAVFNGKSEIHMHLKESVLAGTQVQITREGNELSAVFHTANDQIADLVRQNQEVLRNTLLEERFQLSNVQIHTHGGEREHGQGRSRGQRDTYEERRIAEEDDE